MKALKKLAHFAHEFVWIIGMGAIITYSESRWPSVMHVVLCVMLAASAALYVWLFFILPFRQGLTETRTGSRADDSDSPRETTPHFLSNVMTPKAVLTKWADAFNRRDAAAAASLYHEHATNLQVAVGEPVHGRQAIHDDLTAFFHAFPDSYTHVEQILEEGEWAIIEWSGGGTFAGAFAGHAPTGRSFQLRGCGFFQIIAGKIHLQRGYWDKATWFGQIGLPLE
jgi:steroid delta-isomerase-like uncharacterized protein